MKRNPTMFAASNYSNQINRRKVTAWDRRCPRATFHDTWHEAHAAIVARREAELLKARDRLTQAKSWLKSAERALEKARAMKPPGAPEEEGQRP